MGQGASCVDVEGHARRLRALLLRLEGRCRAPLVRSEQRPENIWHVKKVAQSKMIHLTEKPVELSVRLVQYSSRLGENALDLFADSGSTLIAAEQTGR